ncbi:Serine/threonine protein kinase [Lithohypha guttulata]|uniref:Serine/threonine protein kinase n=1 Tax=Lithohypha guttulata TaxID=1690604 RepID=UPI002DE03646|nr:Serine/threonine protein kinase [Lithohypha guttulata]
MTVIQDYSQRSSSHVNMALEDRFEVLRDIGDGSFGSVALARVKGNGSNIARRGTMIAIKTMKKTFESLAPCLELREVIFLKTLPTHPHLVGALDIFLDPYSKKLHICMEYMDGNLYQLMKARDHKCMDIRSVKSILYQILSGLDHIHAHNFFHRDIKPENILVSSSAPADSSSSFSRYSSLVTPPSTPPAYSIKIADFGLARETQSRLPYTTYVSTRWYRAPEVLLRAGEYSAPVDMWAIGAMAVEIATLKPLFPGGNEVDQVWRVCEIMGSPGNWYTKNGSKVGGGEWRDGTRLAQKLGFSFPKMAPHAMDTILQPPQWPASFASFVTWCLMWDPRNRPTSLQAMEHEFFTDAVDPLRPKSSSRLLGRKHSDLSFRSKEAEPVLTSKPSWFRRSLVARESAPAVPLHKPAPSTHTEVTNGKQRPPANKRATWQGTPASGAPMPILPSIKPISPIPNTVNAQAEQSASQKAERKVSVSSEERKKIGRQLSVNSHGNHYPDVHRAEAEKALNGQSGLVSPPSGQKESFFSHLRKRARRFSGRHGLASPNGDDIEAQAATAPWSNRSSMVVDKIIPEAHTDFFDLDKALQSVRYSLEKAEEQRLLPQAPAVQKPGQGTLKRTHSLQRSRSQKLADELVSANQATGRPRRTLHLSGNPVQQYDIPAEEDELLDEVLVSARRAARRLNLDSSPQKPVHRAAYNMPSDPALHNAYMTPSHSANRDGVQFGYSSQTPSQPMNIVQQKHEELAPSHWPTPPYEEPDPSWAARTAAQIFSLNSASAYR